MPKKPVFHKDNRVKPELAESDGTKAMGDEE
jgi:hypothetical protein